MGLYIIFCCVEPTFGAFDAAGRNFTVSVTLRGSQAYVDITIVVDIDSCKYKQKTLD